MERLGCLESRASQCDGQSRAELDLLKARISTCPHFVPPIVQVSPRAATIILS